MKILYAIQGTGNGHVSRARDIIPILKQHHEVDILISGLQADVQLPYEVKYRYQGLGFIFGKKGGIDLLQTFKKNSINVFLLEINSLPVQVYDLVISDFEPVSAWACYQKNKPCIALSHQMAVLHKLAPKAKKTDPVGKAILKKYAPSTDAFGFHFKAYADNIFTPVIRKQVREHLLGDNGHYTVYLPAYSDKRIIKVLRKCKEVRWQVFSKHNKKVIREGNILVQPISNEAFISSMAASAGVLCGAGFETPAEALFMNKKLMVIPMKGQYEQQCNAAALKEMGVPVIKNLKTKQVPRIQAWLADEEIIEVNYPDITADILNTILKKHAMQPADTLLSHKKFFTGRKLRQVMLKKIAMQL